MLSRKDGIEIVTGVGRVIALSVVLSYLFAFVWSSLDWMRNYGTGMVLSPFAPQPPLPPKQHRFFPAGTLFGWIEDLVELYNVTFRGGQRLGSGLGLFAAAFLTIGPAKRYGLPGRIATGLVTGAIIGGRAALMITSDTPIFIVCLVLGAIATALYLAKARADGTSALPIIPSPATH